MKKKANILLMSILMAVLLIACGQGTSSSSSDTAASSTSSAEHDENSLIVGVSNNIDSMNPIFRTGMASTYVQRYFYESLLNMVGPTEYESRLGDITTEDNQVYTITVNPDAKWTDGEAVDAEDVAYTLNAIADPEVLSSVSGRLIIIEGTDESGKRVEGDTLSGVEIIDSHTVQITTKNPVDENLVKENLGFELLIAPEHVFSEIPKADIQTSEAATHPTVTNGAFQFVENRVDEYVHVTANPDYYRGAPKLEDIYFQIVQGVSMVTELQAGNIHMTAGAGIGVVPDEDIPLVQELENYTVESSVGTGIQYMVLNNESIFTDQKVRQAIDYAIDQELAFQNLLHGNGEITPTPYTSMSPYKNEAVEGRAQDVEKAKQLLEEAGFDYSQPIRMVVPIGNVAREQMADLTQQWLQALGMTVEQEKYDFTTFLSIVREGEYDIAFSGLTQTYEPDIQTTAGTGGASNYSRISDDRLDQYLSEGRAEVDSEKRKVIYDEMQEYYHDMTFQIPLYSEAEYVIKANNLEGGTEKFYNSSLADIHEWYLK